MTAGYQAVPQDGKLAGLLPVAAASDGFSGGSIGDFCWRWGWHSLHGGDGRRPAASGRRLPQWLVRLMIRGGGDLSDRQRGIRTPSPPRMVYFTTSTLLTFTAISLQQLSESRYTGDWHQSNHVHC